MEFKLDINANVELAETPIWDNRIKKLYWTDLFTGDVHQFDPITKEDNVFKTNKLIGSAIPCEQLGKVMCALEDGMYLLDLVSGDLSLIVRPEDNEANRFNDTRCDAEGRIFTSSVSKLYGTDEYKEDMLGAFYMIDTDKSVKKIVDGINQYNAIVWNKDNTIMYVIDTYNETLIAFEYDIRKGPISEPKVVIDFKDKQGMPDGMSIDEEDNLYICHWSKKISVWSSDYELKTEYDFPVEYVCCGGFSGDDKQDFYVATSKYCYGPEELANNVGAGGIFIARSKIKGCFDNFYK